MKKKSKKTKGHPLSEKKTISNDIKYIYTLAGLVFLSGLFLLFWFIFGSGFGRENIKNIYEEISIEQEKEKCNHVRVIDGVCVKTAEDVNPPLVAVMVENHFESWPQSGLSDAQIVYEAPVEGNISRFMAIYPLDSKVEKVGPVRSARPYYLDWLEEYKNIMYMHVGGSPDALDQIKEEDIFNVNEFYLGWYFWRSKDRSAPHNTYTSDKLWNKAWDKYTKDFEAATSTSWAFGEAEKCEADCIDEIVVSFAAPTYQAVWNYNTSTQKYERYQVGENHADQNGNKIEVDTIVVQRVTTKTIDNIGRKSMDTIGDGQVFVFQNGNMLEGIWKKESITDKTRWLDKDGSELPLKPGKIWIEVLNQVGELEY